MVPNSPLTSRREHLGAESKESMQMKQNFVSDWSRSPTTGISRSPMHKNVKECSKPSEDSGSDKDSRVQISSSSIKFLEKGTEGSEGGGDGLPEASELLLDAASDPTLPTEVVIIRINKYYSKSCKKRSLRCITVKPLLRSCYC